MDCCNYGQYGAGVGGTWEGYGARAATAGYVPPPYAPYAHYNYAPHAHDPYARYYRTYDYPAHHMHHNEHVMPVDYGAYAAKDVRSRRSFARREQRAHTPAHHLPLPPTPPLEIGMNGRGPAYGEPQMWSHYQMGVINGGGWNGGHNVAGGWGTRGSCSREHMRHPAECRQIKGTQISAQNPMCQPEGRSTPYPVYEDSSTNYNRAGTPRHAAEYSAASTHQDSIRLPREHVYPEPKRSPPAEKRPPVVPLPAFQQAFGSTEIGKFAEAFSRTEVPQDDTSADNFIFESFSEWDGTTEPQWSAQSAPRDIKCEDNY